MEEETKPKILVVDDEEDLCEILKFNLETQGYDVTTAYSGEEALEKDAASFNLILLDVMMGGMNGFDVAHRLRANEETRNTPIIFLTAKGTENDKIMGFNAGADDYISKPFSIREVLLRIKAVLRRSHQPKAEQKERHQLVFNNQNRIWHSLHTTGAARTCVLAPRSNSADLAYGRDCFRPHGGREHYPTPQEARPLLRQPRDPTGVRLLLRCLNPSCKWLKSYPLETSYT